MVSCFRAFFAEKSRLGQCLQGFVGFLGRIFAEKMPRAVRVWFWGVQSHVTTGSKMGAVHTCFPVWRELKLKTWVLDQRTVVFLVHTCFPVWRELKRITWSFNFLGFHKFTRAFEGNWNLRTPTKPSVFLVHTCFPVWRELKHWEIANLGFQELVFTRAFPFEGNWNAVLASFIKIHGQLGRVHTCFPVWRELKRSGSNTVSCEFLFTRAFPFEGNWNKRKNGGLKWSILVHTCFPVWRELKRDVILWTLSPLVSSHVLSRLKGIETGISRGFNGHRSLFTRAFPFEGNWNALTMPGQYSGISVHTCFPVWRELKLTVPTSTSPFWFFCSHVLSRLKGIETRPPTGARSL